MLKIFYGSALSILFFVLIGLTPTVAHAATYTVTKNTDTADGTCDSDCSLREAVTAANSGGVDTIVLPANTYHITRSGAGEDLNVTGDFDFLDADLTTVTGADMATTIIDSDDLDRAFHIASGARATMSGVTVNDSSVTSANGGGVLNEGSLVFSHVTIQNSVLDNPSGIISQYGAGIYCAAGDITLTDVTVSGNMSADPGVQTVFGGGIGISGDCTSDISRTIISGNSAASGGGMFIDTNTTTTNTLTDVEFTNNTAAVDAGGGLSGSGPEGNNPIVMNRVTFIENTAVAGGGVFAGTPMQITNGTFYNNTASDTGGGFNSSTGDTPEIVIAFSTFTNNHAGIAAGVYSGGFSNVILKNNIIASNFVAPMPSPFYEDCQGNLTSQGYNYIGELREDCFITSVTGDSFNHPVPPSYMATAVPANNGGFVQTLALSGVGDTLNLIPPVSCTDAAGSALITDSRQTSRPQNTNCDIGAYELGYTTPPTAFTATAVGNDVNLAWTNSTDPHFSSVTIRRSTSAYPTSVTDGSAVASGVTGTTRSDNDLLDRLYYYSIFSVDDEGDISVAAQTTVTVDTVTQSPTLSSPGSGSMNRVRLQYSLPEAPLAGSVRVTFTNVATSGTVVFQMENSQSVNFLFNPADSGNQVNFDNLSNINTITPSAMPVLADGTHTVTLSYRDGRNNPATSAVATSVIIDTTTQTPTLTSPASSSFNNALQLQYSLPEGPQSNTISVSFDNASGSTTLLMDTTQSVNSTLQLSNLFTSSHVTSASASTLADGVYTVTLRYQDALGNTTVSAVASTVTLDRAAPTISLLGNSAVTITQGDSYTDAGATATDAVQGVVTSSIVQTGSVDVNTVGTYTLRYNVQDSTGNAATEVTRTVTVVAPEVVPEPVDTTPVDHGAVRTVRQSGAALTVTYADTTTATLRPFGTSKNFRYALSTDKKRIVVTNGKDVRVFKNGVQVAKKTIGKTAYTSANYRIAVTRVYNSYDSVFIAAVKGKTARVYGMRLTTAHTLTKQQSQSLTVTDLSKPVLSVNTKKKQVTVTYGKSGKRVSRTWKLKTNGTFAVSK